MLARHALLPPNATRLEIALSETMDRNHAIAPGLNALRDLKDTPTASVVPYLISEYGLEEIEEFFPVRVQAIAPGIKWRRLIGTPEAVRLALTWIGYRAAIEDQWIGRRRWHTFQFRFPELPAADAPDLARVAKIAEISTALRSTFRRGVFVYDVAAIDADHGCLDHAMLERESGIALEAGGPIWSFGRTREIDHTYSEADGTALGNWIEPTGGGSLTWNDLSFPWEAANFPWMAEGEVTRRRVLAGWFAGRTLYMAFKDALGAVIGYRRCRAARAVRAKVAGPYSFAGGTYEPFDAGELLYVEALTDFGSAWGVTAKSVELIANAAPAPGIAPGRQWLAPGELTGGISFAATPVSIPLRLTVRDKIKYFVRF